MMRGTVAILGAGITGSATALLLARRGIAVHLFDAAPEPFRGASRWNEGKIHLGYLYSADPGLATARSVLPGGLSFRPLTEQLLGTSIEPAITQHDDTYLIHRASVTTPDATERYFEAVSELIRAHPDAGAYLADLRDARARRLSAQELASHCTLNDIQAGFRVPERSVSTNWIADRFVAALTAEPLIEQRMHTRIVGVRAHEHGGRPRYTLLIDGDAEQGPYDFVVNASWESRIAIDATLGLRPPAAWTHRFRMSVFLRTRIPLDIPSSVIATGPFGDIKNYDGRNFYLSWYPAGLIAEGDELAPPQVTALDIAQRDAIARETIERLATFIPAVSGLPSQVESQRVEGGWVYALGRGSLADAGATLHRRDCIGLHVNGRHISIDTEKYSSAPELACAVTSLVLR
jgi:glycine/D-amino acid oxidase-like deaminating enzyme